MEAVSFSQTVSDIPITPATALSPASIDPVHDVHVIPVIRIYNNQ
jgi:hypothetical protein